MHYEPLQPLVLGDCKSCLPRKEPIRTGEVLVDISGISHRPQLEIFRQWVQGVSWFALDAKRWVRYVICLNAGARVSPHFYLRSIRDAQGIEIACGGIHSHIHGGVVEILVVVILQCGKRRWKKLLFRVWRESANGFKSFPRYAIEKLKYFISKLRFTFVLLFSAS